MQTRHSSITYFDKSGYANVASYQHPEPPLNNQRGSEDTSVDAVSFTTMPTLRTFIVEDNPVILNNLIATLEELSDVQVVGSVGSEREAVSALQQRDGCVDLVIVDIFLTSGSGLGVLRSTQDMHPPIRRVVLSNYATPEMRRRCLELGADRVFDKSSELEDLIAYCDKPAAS